MTYYSMDTIRSQAKGHFFSSDANRFFRSRYGETVYQGPGGVYFITSEQFVGSTDDAAPRRYTVRQFIPETGSVTTAGEFNQLSRSQAVRLAKQLSDGKEKL